MTPASPDHAGAPPPGQPSGAGAPVQFRQLDGPAELAAAAALIAEVFGAADGPPMPVDLLAAIRCAGGFVGAALVGGDVAGVAVAFGEVPAPPAAGGRAHPVGLHSHVAAVHPTARGLRIGQRLKWYQREWALARGIEVIRWTFDPLVRRNATLNLDRLGAVGISYQRNLYGSIPDALNAGMESDRLLVRWDLNGPRAVAAWHASGLGSPGTAEESAPGPGPSVTAGATAPSRGIPVTAAPLPHRGPAPLVDTPEDIEGLLARDPAAARAWRQRQRAALEPLLRQGLLVTGITADGRYQLEHP